MTMNPMSHFRMGLEKDAGAPVKRRSFEPKSADKPILSGARYWIQLDGKRHFLHGHTVGASSWKDKLMKKMLTFPELHIRQRQLVLDT